MSNSSSSIQPVLTQTAEILRYTSAQGVNMWYVDGAVGASGDGTSWTTAFKTITEAETARGSGDYVMIRAGTYNENTVIGGLVVAKDSGTFVAVGDSFESVSITNDNGSATDCVTISGDYNSFTGIRATTVLINGWTTTGSDNHFVKCSSYQTSTGFSFNTGTSNTLDDCRVLGCTVEGFAINSVGTFVNNCTGALCLIGMRFGASSVFGIVRHAMMGDNTTGYQFDASSAYSFLDNCSGKNGTNITDNSGGTARLLGFNEESKISAGNTIQDDLKAIYDKIA